MAINGWNGMNWLNKITVNGCKWLELLEMAENGCKLLKVVLNDRK